MTTTTWQLAEADMLDAMLESANYNTNYGASGVYVSVGKASATNRSLFKWPGLSDGTIAATEIIDSATITLTCHSEYSIHNRNHRVYRVKVPWVESQVTWRVRSTGPEVAWTESGAFHSSDCEQTDIGYALVSATITSPETVDIPLSTTAIKEIVDGTWANNGFLIKADTEDSDLILWRSSSDATASYRPKLVVVHHTAGYPKIYVL
jgi:hypothetical protein